jgi:hypothetical protein
METVTANEIPTTASGIAPASPGATPTKDPTPPLRPHASPPALMPATLATPSGPGRAATSTRTPPAPTVDTARASITSSPTRYKRPPLPLSSSSIAAAADAARPAKGPWADLEDGDAGGVMDVAMSSSDGFALEEVEPNGEDIVLDKPDIMAEAEAQMLKLGSVDERPPKAPLPLELHTN